MIPETPTAEPPETLDAAPLGPVECAWCNGLIAPGDPARPTSHGLCRACAAATGVFKAADLATFAVAVRR